MTAWQLTFGDFVALNEDALCEFLASDRLALDRELTAYNAAIAWGRAHCASASDHTALAALLRRVLNFVRFPLMEIEELMQIVYRDALLDVHLVLQAVAFKGFVVSPK